MDLLTCVVLVVAENEVRRIYDKVVGDGLTHMCCTCRYHP